MTTLGSFCTGYGGLDLAVEEVFDAEMVWCSEIDPSANKVIEKRFPGVPNLGDITRIDFEELNHMAAHRNDAKAQEMYDLYCQGRSLAQVAEEFGVTRQTVWKMFDRRGWDMRERPPARPFIDFEGRRFSVRDNGYYAATDGEREYLHRVMWERLVGPIPEGYDVHHLDHDKTNNEIANFECLPKDEHARLYGTGCNQNRHRCGKEVMPGEPPAVDVITAGYQPLSTVQPGRKEAGGR